MKCTGKAFPLFYLLVLILILPSVNLRAQTVAINDTTQQILSDNQYFPSWSADGRIIFRSAPTLLPYPFGKWKKLIFSMKSNNRFHIVTFIGKKPE